jgi:stage IV sporulation protein FB
MLLTEPQPTPADFQFSIAGIPVRVTGWFWVAAALLGWGVARGLAGDNGRMLLVYLGVWVAVVFVSILIHELGHALVFARFRQPARIVLYHFGGLAVPMGLPSRSLQQPWRRLLVAAAGPLAQLLFIGIVILVIIAAGYRLPPTGMVARLPVIGDWLAAAAERGQPLPSRLANLAVYHLLFVNIGWAVLNLLPVPPLDGGTIVLEGLRAAGVSAAVSIASLFGLLIAGTIALWAFQRQDLYLAVMFALLAYGCFQRLSQPRINS